MNKKYKKIVIIRYLIKYVIFAITTFIIVLMGLYVSRETFLKNSPFQNNNENSPLYKNSKYNHLYSREFIIDKITEYGNCYNLTLRDCNGYLWEYNINGYNEFYVNDIVSGVISDNGTGLIFDDKIINIHYSRPDLLMGIDYDYY